MLPFSCTNYRTQTRRYKSYFCNTFTGYDVLAFKWCNICSRLKISPPDQYTPVAVLIISLVLGLMQARHAIEPCIIQCSGIRLPSSQRIHGDEENDGDDIATEATSNCAHGQRRNATIRGPRHFLRSGPLPSDLK